jgi:hypothetical protein
MSFLQDMYAAIGGADGLIVLTVFLLSLLWMPTMTGADNYNDRRF